MNVLIIDKQRLYADGIKSLLQNYDDGFITDYAETTSFAYEKIITGNLPDLIILGINDSFSRRNCEFIKKINEFKIETPIIISSSSNSSIEVPKAIENINLGFISKYYNHDSTLNTILSSFKGDVFNKMLDKQNTDETNSPSKKAITSRQLEVLYLLSHGLLNKQIASELDISTNTVKIHLNDIFRKLNVSNRTAAVKNGRKTGLI